MALGIEKQLAKIIASKTKMSNGRTVKQNLEKAVDYLYDCMDNQIREYYLSYDPKIYNRTFDFRDSLYAENFINARVVGNRIELSVSFRDSMSYHENLFKDHKSFVPVLINFGWKAPKLESFIGRKIDRFTEYDGFHMVEKAISQFNAQNSFGIHISHNDVKAVWNGKPIDKQYYKW